MKSKQLANVLIKLLGLSMCLRAIPACVSGIFSGLISFGIPQGSFAVTRIFISAVGAGVEAAIGIFIICKSKNIAEFLFKNEVE